MGNREWGIGVCRIIDQLTSHRLLSNANGGKCRGKAMTADTPAPDLYTVELLEERFSEIGGLAY